MALFLTTACPSSLQQLAYSKNRSPLLLRLRPRPRPRPSLYFSGGGLKTTTTRASCFFNPTEEPLLKQALKEPVAFMGGVFAGILRLDLDEDPLKDWVSRTVEASSSVDDALSQQQQESNDQESSQQIDIE